MIRRKLVTAIALAGLLPAGLAHAVGLGKVEVSSALNQPLEAEIDLINVGDLDYSQIFVKLASQEDFDRAGVDREYFLTKINFDVVLDRKTGRNVIKLKTRDRVQEPFLNFVVEARWPNGRVLREYTVLLDLPVTQGRTSTPVRPAAVSATRAATQPAPAATAKPVTSTATVTSRTESKPASTRPAGDRMHGAVAAGSYRIQQGDSLWNIAKEHKPGDDLSVQQTMLAIQAMNPEAFYKNNINLIKAGYILRLPDAGTVRQLTYDEAKAEVAAQNQAWREGKERPVPSKISAAVEAAPPAPVAEPEGRLELSASGEAAAAADGAATEAVAPVEAEAAETAVASEAQMDAAEENLAAAEEQNAELQEKLDVMEDQVKTMERLAELKDQQMAALQEGAAQPAPAPQETETASSSLLMYIGAGVLALLAILAFLFMRRKKAVDEAPSPLPQQPVLVARTGTMPPVVVDEDEQAAGSSDTDELDAVAEEVAATAETMEADVADVEEEVASEDATVTMQSVPVAPTEAQTGDVIGEADIYMSLGRHAQAASMLKGAIEKEPSNMKLHLKLLEVYVDSNNKDAFLKHFTSLQGTANAQTIGRAKELLLGVDDAHEWLGEKRNTGEMPTVTMDEISDDILEAAAEDDVPFGGSDEVAEETGDDTDNTEMGIVELEDAGDFDFSSFGAKEAEKAVEAEEPETIDLGVSDDLDFLAGADESNTKLDLARAYIDMGDIDGAKDILQEVIQEGNSAAKDEARKLLASL